MLLLADAAKILSLYAFSFDRCFIAGSLLNSTDDEKHDDDEDDEEEDEEDDDDVDDVDDNDGDDDNGIEFETVFGIILLSK